MKIARSVHRQSLVLVIFPLDYEKKDVGIITDDVGERAVLLSFDDLKGKFQVMNGLLVKPIPEYCRLTVSRPLSFLIENPPT